ncbi:unnamed protein product [Cuscuta europaea]|uniref:Dof zinc finger protein n=1 Tax=Cuscuta europaea TaxID=41803 RepID=A0A9P1E4A6_CUSEU|nr:unnamed protein product [Cuscuta europaea]
MSSEKRSSRAQGMDTRPPLSETENISCPRCHSTNTKFCYYNNYNLSQPRHFCKSCRRYWTRGGSIRNVPVGGSRKPSSGKRSRAARAVTSSSPTRSVRSPVPAVLGLCTGSGRDVNLNETVSGPETAGSFTSLLSSPAVDSGIEYVFGSNGLDYGFGLCDWAADDIVGEAAGGSVIGSVATTSWNPWRTSGGGMAEGGLADVGDCLGWPELAISAPERKP